MTSYHPHSLEEERKSKTGAYATRIEKAEVAPLRESAKVPENCVSQVYVTATLDESGKVYFQGDKGFVGLLTTAMNGLTISEIQALDPSFIRATA